MNRQTEQVADAARNIGYILSKTDNLADEKTLVEALADVALRRMQNIAYEEAQANAHQ